MEEGAVTVERVEMVAVGAQTKRTEAAHPPTRSGPPHCIPVDGARGRKFVVFDFN
jgi:hypothetical protein